MRDSQGLFLYYFPLHIEQGAKGIFPGGFVCESTFILTTLSKYSPNLFKACAYKWETLPHTTQRRETFPVEKLGISRNIHPRGDAFAHGSVCSS